MKVLVLGGTGWLGHHIALQVAVQGHQVTIGSRGRDSRFASEIRGIKRISIDKRDEAAMQKLLLESFDAIIDTVPHPESIDLIHRYAKNLQRYIHCSSTGGYAPLPFIPADETCPYGGFNGTSGWAGKAKVDAQALKLFIDQGFPATIIRPTYITGPGLLPLDNLGGRRKDYLADILAEKVLDVPDNGLALLQPVHVVDLARSFALALTQPIAVGQVYNISLAHAVTLQRYHEITAAALGKTAHLNLMPREEMQKKYEGKIDVIGLDFLATHMSFSIAKAQRDLGYVPHCTPEEAIAETARWGITQQ